ncbi:exopolysaccharide biosynthesis polyprenyl glycosylphosphotransferase [Erythrobacter jejuensis]|uniref:Exopolysaccharide biosynthesis polyprenyl glycosylphosphotransferase n=3 Tax=Pseudomonadota TaxID=1224 RepID=A0A845AQC2_9SPHN|nr:exopolysaccharide biosynthesis polyprenyl glycosylphosphotransferase [Parerythrobacter jejuensis]MXP33855.1 exopolysaccharide biosynthesis polyprenyl glycosylphosphotransferase [Parerythrobacter jejuensis]
MEDSARDQSFTPAPSLERRRLRAYLLLVAVDIAAILVAFFLAGALYLGRIPDPQALRQAYLLLPIFLTIAMYQGTYSLRTLLDARYASLRALSALMIAAALLAFVAFYLKTSATFSRVTLTLGLVLSGLIMVGIRVAAVRLVERRWAGFVRNRLLILDGGPDLPIAANQRVEAARFGLDPKADDPDHLDRLGQVLLNQDEVVVSCPAERRDDWAFALKASGVHGEIVSDTAQRLGAINVHRYEGVEATTLVVSAGPLGLRARAAKRLFDLVFASLALLVLSPFLFLLGLAIWIEDRGPVLFVQKRTGHGNRFFPMLKFRSMRVAAQDAHGTRSTARDDDRVTRIGGFMRRRSIDELPQLINVLRGEMSIVGPRPHAPGSQAGEKLFWKVDSRYWHRHALKPGLTGLAQIRGLRGATEEEHDLSDRLQADLEYIARWSLQRDLAIVWRTLFVLTHERAY